MPKPHSKPKSKLPSRRIRYPRVLARPIRKSDGHYVELQYKIIEPNPNRPLHQGHEIRFYGPANRKGDIELVNRGLERFGYRIDSNRKIVPFDNRPHSKAEMKKIIELLSETVFSGGRRDKVPPKKPSTIR